MTPTLLDQAAHLYGISPHELQPLSGGNFSQVYGFKRDQREAVLRITPPDGGIDLHAMQSILHWMQHLALHDMPVPTPLASIHQHFVETVEVHGQTCLITAVEKAPGVLAETVPFTSWNAHLFEQLGRVTGRMHALARQYTPPPGIQTRPHWDQAVNCYNPVEEIDAAQVIIRQRRSEILERVRTLPQAKDSYGLIHGDLHGANFFVDLRNEHITLFDFDDCCYGWFVMDIAMLLMDFLVIFPGIEREAFASHFLTSFLRGYLPQKSLKTEWLLQLPVFLKLLETGLYTQVHAIAESCAPTSWVGKFMAGRRERIEEGIAYVTLDIPVIVAGLAQHPMV